MNRIGELIDDPSWYNGAEEQKKEIEDMIKEYAKQSEGGGSGYGNQETQVIHG